MPITSPRPNPLVTGLSARSAPPGWALPGSRMPSRLEAGLSFCARDNPASSAFTISATAP